MSALPNFQKGRLIGLLGAILCFVPFGMLAVLIGRYGVNLPFSDQWELVLLLMKSRGPGVEFSDLLAQHGEQRMFFPRLIMLALAPMTGWNIRVELLVNLLLAAGIFLVLVLLLVRTLKPLRSWVIVPAAVLSLMIFSPVQWENWFWGWQISWYLPLFLFVFTAALLWLWPEERPAWPAVGLAAAAALAGQYSLLSATLIWVTCLAVVLFRANLRKWWWVWVGCGTASTAFYLRDYTSPPAMDAFHMSPSVLLEEPERPLAYLFYLLGRPVLDQFPSYFVGGMFLVAFLSLAGYFAFLKRDRLNRALVWLVTGGYALGLGLTTTAGRLGIGLEFAGSSRYTTIGILFMAATAVLVAVAILPEPDARSPAGAPGSGGPPENAAAFAVSPSVRVGTVLAVWALIGGLYIADYDSEVDTLKLWHTQRIQIKQCLETASSPGDPCLLAAYPASAAVFERTQFLKSIGWGGFGTDHTASER